MFDRAELKEPLKRERDRERVRESGMGYVRFRFSMSFLIFYILLRLAIISHGSSSVANSPKSFLFLNPRYFFVSCVVYWGR